MTDFDGKKYPECQPSPVCKWCEYDSECGKIIVEKQRMRDNQSVTKYELEHGIHEWHCKSCGSYFDNLDVVTLEKTCAFCGSLNIEPIFVVSKVLSEKEV